MRYIPVWHDGYQWVDNRGDEYRDWYVDNPGDHVSPDGTPFPNVPGDADEAWCGAYDGETDEEALARYNRQYGSPFVEDKDGKKDPINKPPHYTYSRIETIDAIEAWGLGYHLGNVVKYVSRAGRKDDAKKDLEKARWYLDRAIANLDKADDSAQLNLPGIK